MERARRNCDDSRVIQVDASQAFNRTALCMSPQGTSFDKQPQVNDKTSTASASPTHGNCIRCYSSEPKVPIQPSNQST